MKKRKLLIIILFISLINFINCNNRNFTIPFQINDFGYPITTETTNYLYNNNEYIIMFNKYYNQNEHFKIISNLLNRDNLEFPTFEWKLIERNNAASKLPSDFVLVSFNFNEKDEFLDSLKLFHQNNNNIIKYIFPEKKIIDPLKGWQLHQIEDEFNDINEDNNNNNHTKQYIKKGKLHSEIPELNSDMNLEFSINRKLKDIQVSQQITELLGANEIWDKGFTGKGIKVAIFDTGLDKLNPNFKNIVEITDWTGENLFYSPTITHGTFVASLIASQGKIFGFAPESDLYIYRVFDSSRASFTSWFLDAFNHAIQTRVDILNLSIGGPDFLDQPFVEKVRELSANNIIVISAIGNDGPIYGTLNNPADQLDVIGVGGINFNGNIAEFSSRGMTTWEIPEGYGRVKPDLVTYGHSVEGLMNSHQTTTISGTSVSCPIVAGVVSLLISSINNGSNTRSNLVNPGSIKQILIESSDKIPNINIFEQGAGKLNLLNAFNLSAEYKPKITFHPSTIDLKNCPYMWPYCTQELYHSTLPIIANISIINGISVSSEIKTPPIWRPGENGEHLKFKFQYQRKLWPWSGYLGVYIEVPEESRDFEGIAQGFIELNITSHGKKLETIQLPVRIPIIPTPPREKRILWDQFHNLRYPSGYFPTDAIGYDDHHTFVPFDWNGDHIHTNFKTLYNELRMSGYYIEIIGSPLSCFNPLDYGTLLIVDPEEEFHPLEIKKLEDDIRNYGLNLIIFADWYDTEYMSTKANFTDSATKQVYIPATGGSNIPALNDLLSLFGIYLDGSIYDGPITINQLSTYFSSGTSIIGFPANGKLLYQTLLNQSRKILNNRNSQIKIPILGFFKPSIMDNEYSDSSLSSSSSSSSSGNNNSSNSGTIVIYGDSNCIDEKFSKRPNCYWLIKDILASIQSQDSDSMIKEKFPEIETLDKPLLPINKRMSIDIPQRSEIHQKEMLKYSKILKDNYHPVCSNYQSKHYVWYNQYKYENVTWFDRSKVLPSLQVPLTNSKNIITSETLKNQFLVPGYIGVTLVGVFLIFLFFNKDKIRKLSKRASNLENDNIPQPLLSIPILNNNNNNNNQKVPLLTIPNNSV